MLSPPIPLLSQVEVARLRAEMAVRPSELARELDWLDTLDLRHAAGVAAPADFTVAVFNAERGSRFDGIRTLLATHPALRRADVLLLNEVDWGMARSGNRHVARALADALGLGYVFGIEFLELTKGEGPELEAPGENTWGLHGNAILSRYPLSNPRLLRLPRHCSWAEGTQLRIGGRMAVIADMNTVAGPLTIACTHLENRTTPAGRSEQMRVLLEAIGPDRSAVIGGDLNTSTIDSGRDEELFAMPDLLRNDPHRLRRPQAYEPLFGRVRAAGFLIDEVNETDTPTNVPFGLADTSYWPKIDWIFARAVVRGAHHDPPQVIAAQHAGSRVSDHDFVVAHVGVPTE